MPLYYHTSITVAKCGILLELHFQIVYKNYKTELPESSWVVKTYMASLKLHIL